MVKRGKGETCEKKKVDKRENMGENGSRHKGDKGGVWRENSEKRDNGEKCWKRGRNGKWDKESGRERGQRVEVG